MIMKKVDMMTYENGEERQQRIRERAYEIWEEEGYPQGRSDIHWLRASEEFEQAARNEAAADAAHAASELPSTAKQSQETAPKKRIRPPRRS